MGGKTVSSIRYFNAAGQEMSEANGLTIMVTTYTDGTTTASKAGSAAVVISYVEKTSSNDIYE